MNAINNNRILWLSRHNPTPSQINKLKIIYGPDVQIDQKYFKYRSAQAIKQMYLSGKYVDLVIVAPMSVISKLIAIKAHPLWAEMTRVSPVEAETFNNGRYYKFVDFKRVKALNFVLTPV